MRSYLDVRKRQGKEAIEFFYPLVCSPESCNNQGWDGLKLGARSFFQVLFMGTVFQGIGASFAVIPGHQQELRLEVKYPGLKSVPLWDAVPQAEA